MSLKRTPSPSTPRLPLNNSTNDLHAQPPSPPYHSAKTSQSKRVRRKVSSRVLHTHIDSSESLPSEHSSIYEALYLSHSTESLDKPPPAPSPWADNTSHTLAPSSEPATTLDPPSWPITPIPTQHTPHKLEPITEQKSISTLRPGSTTIGTSSLTHRTSSLLSTRPSTRTLRAVSSSLSRTRRKQSFSLDDLPSSSLPQSTHPSRPTPTSKPKTKSKAKIPTNLCSLSSLSTSSSTLNAAHPSTPTPYPTLPHAPPPLRTPTPPGLPTFNTPAAIAYRLPSPRLRFRDYFRLSPTNEERMWVRQTQGLPRGALMRGEDGTLVRGRWRPGGSGHTGWGCGVGGQRLQRVAGDRGGERSAVGGDERGRNASGGRNTGGERAASAGAERRSGVGVGSGGAERSAGGGGTGKQTSLWDRIGEGFCFVCCGVEKEGGGEEEVGMGRPRVVERVEGRVGLGGV